MNNEEIIEEIKNKIYNINIILNNKNKNYNILLEKLSNINYNIIIINLNISMKKTEYDSLKYNLELSKYDLNFDNMLIYSLTKERENELNELYNQEYKIKYDINILESSINKINLEILSHTEYLFKLNKQIEIINRCKNINEKCNFIY